MLDDFAYRAPGLLGPALEVALARGEIVRAAEPHVAQSVVFVQ